MFDPIVRSFVSIQAYCSELVNKSRNEEGATAVEYGLLVALIAGVIAVTVAALGTKLNGMFTTVTGNI
jgi:pilus assembly protein Flp/PilA